MKNIFTKITFATLILAGMAGVYQNSEKRTAVEVEAANADSYWSTVDSKANADTIFTKLAALIDVPKLSGGYSGLWDAYKTSDVVPGTQLIWDMYGGIQFSTSKQGKSYSKEGDGYNREHSVPKSWWGGTEDERYCDLMYLVPTDGYVNNQRSNYAFGEVSSASYSYSFNAANDGYGNQIQVAGVSKLGTGKTINGISAPSKVFEPDDQYKGDFARMYYYYANRYGPKNKMATSGDGAKMFNSNSSDFYMTAYGKALMNKWHVQDPVSQKELDRNDAVEDIQGNRNPYVDHPEWADKIFGSNYAETHGQATNDPTLNLTASATSVGIGSTVTLTANKTNLTGTVNWYFEDGTTNIASLSSTTGDSVTLTGLTQGNVTVCAYVGTIYKSITISVVNTSVAQLTITANKTFYVGDTISSSDITVKNSVGTTISGYTFTDNGYQFTYEDAESGGALTNKTFANAISYNSITYPLTVQVQRKAKSSASSVGGSDTLTSSDFAATSTSYVESTVTKSSGATFAAKTAKDSSGNIQMNSKNNYGIVMTASGGNVTKVSISVGTGTKQINVYGKDIAYSSTADLYNASTKGTLVGSVTTTGEVTFNTSYSYIGITSNSGAIYVSSIEITYAGAAASETAESVANYIMYEDTVGQCATKFPVAKEYFENLSPNQRSEFMTSTDYVIAKARERLIAWANSIGSTIENSSGDYVITPAKAIVNNVYTTNEKDFYTFFIVGGVSVCVLFLLVLIKRKLKIRITK